MSSDIRTLGKHTLVYGAGIAISKLASFIMLPIYTRYLTPADYGVLELLTITIDVVGMIAGIGLAAAVFRLHAEYDDPREKNSVISTAGIALLVLALASSSVGVAAATPLTRLVFGATGNPLYFKLFFVILLLQTAETVPLAFVRLLRRSKLFVILSVSKLLAMLSLNVYFVVLLRMGVLGVLVSNLIASGCLAVFLTAFLFRRTGFAFSLPKFQDMAGYGYPLVFWYLGNFIIMFSDRYCLNYFAGTGAVGIYALAYKLALILTAIAFTPFRMIWDPHRFVIAKQANAHELYPRIFTYLNVALGLVALLIALSAREFLRVMAEPEFLPAHSIVPLLLVGQMILHWTGYCNLGLLVQKKTVVLARLSGLSVIAALLLYLLLIPRYGVPGAAWATVGAYSIRFGGVFIFAQKYYRVRYQWTRIAKLYSVLALAWAAHRVPNDPSVIASLLLGAVLTSISALGVYRFVLDPGEQAAVLKALHAPQSLLRFWRARAAEDGLR